MKSSPVSPTATGSTATAANCAARDTVVLTPDATPAWRSSTEPRAVAVSGATVVASPRPMTTTAGSTAVM
jgi:hypothetical protein